ncbi:hypothetical protein FDECE_16472, partial [Fusarium decemcellulare]
MLVTATVAVVALGMSLWATSGLLGSSTTADTPEPWIMTGWPSPEVPGNSTNSVMMPNSHLQADVWRVRVCRMHWVLHQRDPYSPPKPLHAALNLDATAKPFKPQSFSASPGTEWYELLKADIADATDREVAPKLDWMANHLPGEVAELDVNDEVAPEKEWAYLLMEIAAILADDEIRGHYAQWFVPELTGVGVKGMLMGEECVLEARIRALKKLLSVFVCGNHQLHAVGAWLVRGQSPGTTIPANLPFFEEASHLLERPAGDIAGPLPRIIHKKLRNRVYIRLVNHEPKRTTVMPHDKVDSVLRGRQLRRCANKYIAPDDPWASSMGFTEQDFAWMETHCPQSNTLEDEADYPVGWENPKSMKSARADWRRKMQKLDAAVVDGGVGDEAAGVEQANPEQTVGSVAKAQTKQPLTLSTMGNMAGQAHVQEEERERYQQSASSGNPIVHNGRSEDENPTYQTVFAQPQPERIIPAATWADPPPQDARESQGHSRQEDEYRPDSTRNQDLGSPRELGQGGHPRSREHTPCLRDPVYHDPRYPQESGSQGPGARYHAASGHRLQEHQAYHNPQPDLAGGFRLEGYAHEHHRQSSNPHDHHDQGDDGRRPFDEWRQVAYHGTPAADDRHDESDQQETVPRPYQNHECHQEPPQGEHNHELQQPSQFQEYGRGDYDAPSGYDENRSLQQDYGYHSPEPHGGWQRPWNDYAAESSQSRSQQRTWQQYPSDGPPHADHLPIRSRDARQTPQGSQPENQPWTQGQSNSSQQERPGIPLVE